MDKEKELGEIAELALRAAGSIMGIKVAKRGLNREIIQYWKHDLREALDRMEEFERKVLKK